MARDYYVFGETMVDVSYIFPTQETAFENVELGLSEEAIHISPQFYYHPIYVDDYGPMVPAEKLWMLGESVVTMTLVHFDTATLKDVIQLSMGGSTLIAQMKGAGTPMGGGANLLSAGNNYVRLRIRSIPTNDQAYIFPACHLMDPQPLLYPVGTSYSKVRLTWKSVPFHDAPYSAVGAAEIISSNSYLWSRA